MGPIGLPEFYILAVVIVLAWMVWKIKVVAKK